MINLSDIIKELISESLTYNELFRISSFTRKQAARGMRVERMKVNSSSNPNSWDFAYRSNPSTSVTGETYEGRITFQKPTNPNDRADDVPCVVDCSCPDFRHRYAYANNKQGASPIGNDSLNKCINKSPDIRNPRQKIGMCKHLLSLKNEMHKRLTTSKKNTLRERLDEVSTHFNDVEVDIND